MKKFSELGIKVKNKGFIGDSIEIERVLNKKIIVHGRKFAKSIFETSEKCLHLQIEMNGRKRVIFTSGKNLIEAMEAAEDKDFPFETKITKDKEDKSFNFN